MHHYKSRESADVFRVRGKCFLRGESIYRVERLYMYKHIRLPKYPPLLYFSITKLYQERFQYRIEIRTLSVSRADQVIHTVYIIWYTLTFASITAVSLHLEVYIHVLSLCKETLDANQRPSSDVILNLFMSSQDEGKQFSC